MNELNYSVVSEIVFKGIFSSWTMQHLLLGFSSIFYVAIVLGNLLIILTVTFDPQLQSPMYFFLVNLSLIDMCLSSVVVPKMISDLFYECKTISFHGCITQIFFIHFLGGIEMVLLISMAFDRYIAICKPLHYLTIMNPKTCTFLQVSAWVIGLMHSLTQLAFVVNLPFCGPNEVDSFYCDLPRLIKLACVETYKLEVIVSANSGLISICTVFLLFISYIYILFTVQKHSSSGMSKALSTLSAHISVVILFFGPCIFIYVWPFPTMPVDKFIAIIDFIITPILNPSIYAFRNKDMKVAVKRLSSQLVNFKKIS
ncbi:olfactory receptor 4F6-like [Macrotis lagotis]|uniref:olfactory receptor 4F6-like n=1 Tax=Macrotis lagotis TaxID=92651 RepID=UPI003D688611